MEFLNLTLDQWIDVGISLLLVVIVVALGHRLVALLLNQGFRRVTRRTRTTFDDTLLEVVRLPVYWLIVVIALQIAVERIDFLPVAWNEPLNNLFFVLYFLVGFLFVWRFVDKVLTWFGHEMALRTETPLDEQLLPFFRRIALILVALIGLITLLSHFGVNVSAMVTTLGIASLAIALAAQTSLSDTINGFLIMLDRPFRIGDRIEILDINTWGDVVDIGLRSTRIRTRDNRMVIVPNSVIGQSLIVNHSYPDTQYRIQVHVGVAYGTDIEFARKTIIEAVRKVEGVVQERPVEALFLEFGDSALIFRVRWWIRSYQDTRQMFDRVNTAVYKALQEAGIQIPFPQRDVHHKIDPEDGRRFAQLLRLDRGEARDHPLPDA
jgi:small-conductance mechanosensitive channel